MAREPVVPTPPSLTEIDSISLLREVVVEDLRTHHRSWGSPGFQALLAVRIGRYARSLPVPLRKAVTLAYRILRRRVRYRFGIELDATVTVGRRVHIGHHGTIVIHRHAELGDGVLIRQGVTIGAASEESFRDPPRIGAGVEIGAGAMIIGPVAVGDGVRIGPNAVVTTDVPANASVMSPASRIMVLR